MILLKLIKRKTLVSFSWKTVNYFATYTLINFNKSVVVNWILHYQSKIRPTENNEQFLSEFELAARKMNATLTTRPHFA